MLPARRSRLPSRIAPDGGRNEDEGTKQRLHGKSNAGERIERTSQKQRKRIHEHQLVHRLHFMFGSETNYSGHAGRTISISYDAIVLPHCEIDKVFVSPFDMSF
ncbi:hypothetical protein ALC53_01617 [Atta colombica]|uniref:Uncharacterized protein n=1 Tax=Atta colombica TaxID=520822 RepID=A0A195BV46_9HYME|nr:hypothetical protein ALC53_01617 [Atta colombica]